MKYMNDIFKKEPPHAKDYATAESDRLNIPDLKEREKSPRLFTIWYIEPAIQLSQKYQREIEQAEDWLTDREELVRMEQKRIKEVQQDSTKRLFLLRSLKPTELVGELEVSFYSQDLSAVPELVLIRQDKDIYQGGIGGGEAELIRKKIHQLAEKKGILDQEKIIQPIIAVIAADPEKKEMLLEQGADLVINDFDIKEIEKLAQLTAKIKSDPASLQPEIVKEKKRQFYQVVELEKRVEITANTEIELKILREVIDKNKVKNLLDVGCGSGRIDLPLAEKDKNLNIIALDGSEKLLEQAEKSAKERKIENIKFIKGDLIDYSNHPDISHKSQEAVIYTWHSLLEAFGAGNVISSLRSAWLALKEGGVLLFDLPSRKNKGMEDGWYYNQESNGAEYLAYVPTEDEIKFLLKVTGFADVEINHWKTQPSDVYPEGMAKITVTAKKKV